MDRTCETIYGRLTYKGENMKKTFIAIFILIILFAGTLAAQDNLEKKKIDFLITSVENLKDAKFIRNDEEYDARKAADHLRLKLNKAGERVKTADDFIKLCASKSYMTGKPYMIKYSNGKTVESGKFLREKLKEFKSDVKYK
jgi:hypothetical protein